MATPWGLQVHVHHYVVTVFYSHKKRHITIKNPPAPECFDFASQRREVSGGWQRRVAIGCSELSLNASLAALAQCARLVTLNKQTAESVREI